MLTPPVYLFVYGTLKRGYWNHAPYMTGLSLVNEGARVPGRILLRRSLTPILALDGWLNPIAVPGTPDLDGDLLSAQRSGLFERQTVLAKTHAWAHGELYRLDHDPGKQRQQMMCLDELEDYLPGRPESSLYERVLIPAVVGHVAPQVVSAWAYRIPNGKDPADYLTAKNPSCWRGEVELPSDYFQQRQTPPQPPQAPEPPEPPEPPEGFQSPGPPKAT